MPVQYPFPLLITVPRYNFRERGWNQNDGKGLDNLPMDRRTLLPHPLTLAGRRDWLHAWSPGGVMFWDLEARSWESFCFFPGLVEPSHHEEARDNPEKAPM